MLYAVERGCSYVVMFICSYDHVRSDKTSVTKTSAFSDSSQSCSLQTENGSASRRPVNLHSGVSSDVTSTMTTLSRNRRTETSHVNEEGMIIAVY